MALAPLQSPILHLSLSPFITPSFLPQTTSTYGSQPPRCSWTSPLTLSPVQPPCPKPPQRCPLPTQTTLAAAPGICVALILPHVPLPQLSLQKQCSALQRGNPVMGCTTGTEGNCDGAGSLQHQAGMLHLQWAGTGVLLPWKNFCRRH